MKELNEETNLDETRRTANNGTIELSASSATGGRRQSLITFIDIIVAAGIFVILGR